MHISYDISQTGSGKAGCGYFAHAMLKAMLQMAPEHEFTLLTSFGDFYFDRHVSASQYGEHGRRIRTGPRHFTRELAGAFWRGPDVERELGEPDILHANNFWCAVPLAATRLVYTLYDLCFMAEPDWTTEANRVGCFEGVFQASLMADWIVAISEASRAHFLGLFPHFPAERISVVYPCSRFVDDSVQGRRPAALEEVEPGGFWLSVGTIEPRKNQHRLVEAYAGYLAGGGRPLPLVLAGGSGWLMEDFDRHLERLGVRANVRRTGYVDDEELVWLYRNCYANVYTSLFEGFGLPVLEGMQFGAATVTSASTSIPEVAGEAAILVDPFDVAALTNTMLRLSENIGEVCCLRTAALQRARAFDWKDSAARLLDIYDRAASLPKRRDLP